MASAMVVVIASCGGRDGNLGASSTTVAATTALVETFDGATLGFVLPEDGYSLDLGETGVARFMSLADYSPGTIALVAYPPEYTMAAGRITMSFRPGANPPNGLTVGFWVAEGFQQTVRFEMPLSDPTAAFIGWSDVLTGTNAGRDIAIPEGAYHPDDFNEVVIDFADGLVSVSLNGQALEAVPVSVTTHFGSVHWGMFPTAPGQELIVAEFTATPAP